MLRRILRRLTAPTAAPRTPEPPPPPPPDPRQVALAYHARTKHYPGRYARSLGYLDWDSQPDPFRRFEGAPLHPLPRPAADGTPPYDALFAPEAPPIRPPSIEQISAFFFYSMALSAWKEVEDTRWSLRVNPSSGNLHPTEAYLVAPALPGLHDRPALYHYAPKEHALERRLELDPARFAALTAGLPPGSMLVGLTSIHWRESWKYGERAYRYCQHDVGHALGALRLSAAAQGWQLRELSDAEDAAIARLLGTDRPEARPEGDEEHPDLVAVLSPAPAPGWSLPDTSLSGPWLGRANRLSADHQSWEVIEVVAEACARPAGLSPLLTADPVRIPPSPPRPARFGAIARQRRSAVAMDGHTGMESAAFFALLRRLVPAHCPSPYDALPGPPRVHLGLFVHRVQGLPPGLYALARANAAVPRLRAGMRPQFRWERAPQCPEDLDLFLLHEADVRGISARVSCGQSIAADGAFSLGMLAELGSAIAEHGAWFYPRLFWECGLVGQVLYLEAEAAGLRGTGIGCFFDDSVHEVFGLSDGSVQSLYHFTIGGPVEDSRLSTLPAYAD